MRKMYKKKKRSCAMCKPHKMQGEHRWKPKEEQALKAFEIIKQKYKNALAELAD